MVPMDARRVIVKELNVIGEIPYVWTSWKKAIDFVEGAKVKLDHLVSEV